jgi:hypothetical protein
MMYSPLRGWILNCARGGDDDKEDSGDDDDDDDDDDADDGDTLITSPPLTDVLSAFNSAAMTLLFRPAALMTQRVFIAHSDGDDDDDDGDDDDNDDDDGGAGKCLSRPSDDTRAGIQGCV